SPKPRSSESAYRAFEADTGIPRVHPHPNPWDFFVIARRDEVPTRQSSCYDLAFPNDSDQSVASRCSPQGQDNKTGGFFTLALNLKTGMG
ncbi:MAG: hypothetical protein HN727_16770, partial [Opitutae bacterium]|nr:hypothetical protein [Opitutae bacterium]